MCPTRYQTRHFFNNSNTDEYIVTKAEQGYVRTFPYLDKWKSESDTWRTSTFREECYSVWYVPEAHNWSQPLCCNHHNSCIYGNLQQFRKSTGRWGTLNWIFPAGWRDFPHFTRQRARNSVLFQRPRHFEESLATALAQSDAAWLFLMWISEREVLPKQTTNHGRHESKHRRRNSGSDSGHTGKEFLKYGSTCSILSGPKWWPLPANIMMSSHFLHNEVRPLQMSLQYPH